ncbi:hypothetical protein PUNSTDRAFT_96574 [Punctularia strigosozonata HHB-11173 SS5]|uniref:uncharacterized protein n=1 Tax=Punctularia strigosozonata (strain HHB-11173) TaxID=741275 RepID=UPI0004416BF7|nr:uncharacterized protein PUNSTDRAFT_96574 [Punctularia strigosozonata HHB-11173 SS5]EIN14603.1 hypothetical protein PUNSTDRAFT_96574 [Punctularia strigosozonata HHB-11173 SS5]
MEGLPIDTSHPAVRDYLSLIRLQVLTPLSLLINIATVMVCTIVVSPSLDEISREYPTSLTPKPWMIAVYVVAVYLLQVGFCLLLVIARKPETKQTLIKGVGQSLVWANWTMAGWAAAFLLQQFLVATVLVGITTLILLLSNLKLLWLYPPTNKRPIDTALIHAPLRLFLILPFGLLLWQSLFITIGYSWNPGTPQHYARHQWAGFGVVIGFNILSLLIVIFRRDVVWCAGATWLAASLWSQTPKPMPIQTTETVFTVVHPVALACATLYLFLRHKDRRQEDEEPSHGPIHLPPDAENAANGGGHSNGPREVDAQAVWG